MQVGQPQLPKGDQELLERIEELVVLAPRHVLEGVFVEAQGPCLLGAWPGDAMSPYELGELLSVDLVTVENPVFTIAIRNQLVLDRVPVGPKALEDGSVNRDAGSLHCRHPYPVRATV